MDCAVVGMSGRYLGLHLKVNFMFNLRRRRPFLVNILQNQIETPRRWSCPLQHRTGDPSYATMIQHQKSPLHFSKGFRSAFAPSMLGPRQLSKTYHVLLLFSSKDQAQFNLLLSKAIFSHFHHPPPAPGSRASITGQNDRK